MRGFVKRYSFSSFAQKILKSARKEELPPKQTYAERVLQKIDKKFYNENYITKLKNKVDLQQHIQDLQNEMKQQIARALKKSEEKLLYLIHITEGAYKHLTEIKNSNRSPTNNEKQLVKQYIELRKECEKAKWQFLVHRHSIGFTLKNHELVNQLYKIPEKIEQNYL